MRNLFKLPLLLVFSMVLWTGCQSAGEQAVPVVDATFVIDGLAISGPDTIQPGWNRIRVENRSNMTHFLLFDKMPDSLGVWDHKEVAAVYQQAMDLVNEGKPEEALGAFAALPAWFAQVQFLGGPGFIGPNDAFEMDMFVEEGRYVVECYVKTNGIFHSYTPAPDALAMVHQLDVTGEPTTNTPPQADLAVRISSDGIVMAGEPAVGVQTFSVNFVDQIAHETGLRHDVQLVRLEDGQTLETVAPWMNVLSPTGLETPAPAHFEGGVNEMPAGQTAYFTVELTAGRYALIAETPDPLGKHMAIEFAVE
jgi:hypothetical protein